MLQPKTKEMIKKVCSPVDEFVMKMIGKATTKFESLSLSFKLAVCGAVLLLFAIPTTSSLIILVTFILVVNHIVLTNKEAPKVEKKEKK